MIQALLIQKAIEEIETKTFDLTKQFLEVHEIVYEEGKPKVARVDTEKENDAIVYFPVKGEKFYLAIYLDLDPHVSVRWIGTEPYNSVSFCAFSEYLSLRKLSEMTLLRPIKGWNIGDKKLGGKSSILHKESKLIFEPNAEADEFEDKIEKLLDFLENDKENVKRLVEIADGNIQVAVEFHNGNTMLGGVHLNKEILKRLAGLNLKIDFDLYIGGNLFKS